MVMKMMMNPEQRVPLAHHHGLLKMLVTVMSHPLLTVNYHINVRFESVVDPNVESKLENVVNLGLNPSNNFVHEQNSRSTWNTCYRKIWMS